MFTSEELQNQYIIIRETRQIQDHPFVSVLKLGKVQLQEATAGYLIELEDYAKGFDDRAPFSDVRTIDNKTTAYLSYSGACRAEIITEKEFHDNVIKLIVKQLSEVSNDEAWCFRFKITSDRRALIHYLQNNTKPGLVLI